MSGFESALSLRNTAGKLVLTTKATSG